MNRDELFAQYDRHLMERVREAEHPDIGLAIAAEGVFFKALLDAALAGRIGELLRVPDLARAITAGLYRLEKNEDGDFALVKTDPFADLKVVDLKYPGGDGNVW